MLRIWHPDPDNPNTATHHTLHANDVIQNTSSDASVAVNNHACRPKVHNRADSASSACVRDRNMERPARICFLWKQYGKCSCLFMMSLLRSGGCCQFKGWDFSVFSRANKDPCGWYIRCAVSKTPHLFLILFRPLKLKTGSAGGGKTGMWFFPFPKMYTNIFFYGGGNKFDSPPY